MELPVVKGLEIKTPIKQETKQISMDLDSQAMMMRAMSDAIYQDKPGSMVRELTTNAWDANKEANSKDPVIIKVTDNQLIIKDSGNGLSPEIMDLVWLNLCKSTKRESNESHGGWGIGSKTPLAYTDNFTMKTISEGVCYIYFIAKTSTLPDVILQSETEDLVNCGTEMIVNIRKGDRFKIEDAIKAQLLYFDNLYVEGVSGWNNNYKLHNSKEDNFIINSDFPTNKINICLGQVAYPFPDKYMTEFCEMHSISLIYFNDLPIGLKFNIGELPVIFSREALELNDTVKEKLFDKLNASLQEICNIYTKTTIDETSIIKVLGTNDVSSNMDLGGLSIDFSRFPSKYIFKKTYSNFKELIPEMKKALHQMFLISKIQVEESQKVNCVDNLIPSNSKLITYYTRHTTPNFLVKDVVKFNNVIDGVILIKKGEGYSNKKASYLYSQTGQVGYYYIEKDVSSFNIISGDKMVQKDIPKKYIDQLKKEVYAKVKFISDIDVPKDYFLKKKPSNHIQLTILNNASTQASNASYAQFKNRRNSYYKKRYILFQYKDRAVAQELKDGFNVQCILCKEEFYEELLLDNRVFTPREYMRSNAFRDLVTVAYIRNNMRLKIDGFRVGKMAKYNRAALYEINLDMYIEYLSKEDRTLYYSYTTHLDICKSTLCIEIIDYVERTNYNFFNTAMIDMMKQYIHLLSTTNLIYLHDVQNDKVKRASLLKFKTKGILPYLTKNI